jgi:hypothetical protein
MGALLDAIMGQQYKPTDNAYGIGAAGVVDALPMLSNPYGSTGKNALYTLGGTLLGGILAGYARREADTQNKAMFSQALAMRSMDPVSMEAAISAEPRLANYGSALLEQQQLQEMENAKLERQNTLDIQKAKEVEGFKLAASDPFAYEQAMKRGLFSPSTAGKATAPVISSQVENQATGQELAQTFQAAGGNKDAQSVQMNEQIEMSDEQRDALRYEQLRSSMPKAQADKAFKTTQDLNNEAYERATKLPVYNQISDISSSFKGLVSLAEEDSKIANIGMINSLARIWDPSARITDSDYTLNANAQSALDTLVGDWKTIVSGKGNLSADTKSKMIAAGAQKYNSFIDEYETATGTVVEDYARQGANKNNIPLPKFDKYEISQPKSEPNTIESATGGDYKAGGILGSIFYNNAAEKGLDTTDQVLGPITNALSGATLGGADELFAAGSGAMGFLQGEGYGKSYKDAKTLFNGIKDKYANARPVASTTMQLAGGIKTLAKTPTLIKPADGLIKTTIKGAGEVGAASGVAGFLDGEGASDRVTRAFEGATSGAKFGGAVGGTAKALGKTFDALAKKYPTIEEYFLQTAAGAKPSDFMKANKGQQALVTKSGEGLLKTNLKTAQKLGVFEGAKGYGDVYKNVVQKQEKLEKGINVVIKAADKAKGEQAIFPSFKNARIPQQKKH